MRNLILGIFVIFGFLTMMDESYAQCSCLPTFYTAYDEFEGSKAVFVGEVIEAQKGKAIEDSEYFEFDVKFKVTAAWKAEMSESVTVKNISYENSEFENGKTYLVYARFRDNSLSANIGCCNRTRLLSKAAGDLKMFKRKGEKNKKIVRK